MDHFTYFSYVEKTKLIKMLADSQLKASAKNCTRFEWKHGWNVFINIELSLQPELLNDSLDFLVYFRR